MSTRSRLITAALAASCLMALSVGAASANNLSLSHSALTKWQFEQMKFKAVGVTQAECDVTLEGSFHVTTFGKVERSLLGFVTRAILGTCDTGAAAIRGESLPWHIQYGGFNGTLPTPRPKLRVIGARFLINSIFGRCLATTSETNPAVGILEPEYERGGNGIVRRITLDNGPSIPTDCGVNATFEGNAAVSEISGSQNVLVRLI